MASRLTFLLTFLGFVVICNGQDLKSQIRQLVAETKGTVGVAIKHLESGESLDVNGREHFPMQSVFKFPLALAVLNQVDTGRLALSDKVYIRKADLMEKTHSPMLKLFKADTMIVMTVQQLLEYNVSQSDNNACDLLFKLVGGPEAVHQYIRRLDVTGIQITNTEKEMHATWDAQFNNWSEPLAMVKLLEMFDKKNILSLDSRALLWKLMIQTSTGPKRIKGLLPEGTVVAHRTGTGAPDKNGITPALNNSGIIVLPDQTHLAIAVFITDSPESPDKLEAMIARISKAAYDHYAKQK
jgi:beta-lactamase class A